MKELVLLTVLAVLGKFIESSRTLVVANGASRMIRVKDAYELMNFHNALTVGLFGYMISAKATGPEIIAVICVIVGGAGIKGSFSCHNPSTLRLNDWDSFFGMYVPNALSIGVLAYILAK